MRETNLLLEHPIHSGIQRLYRFGNGYGASVVRHSFSYGSDEGLWELAVIRYLGENERFVLVYDTSVSDDVIGHLSETDVNELLNKIEAL